MARSKEERNAYQRKRYAKLKQDPEWMSKKREWEKPYREGNKTVLAERAREYRQKHPDRIRDIVRESRDKNASKIREAQRRHQEKRMEKCVRKRRAYKTRKDVYYYIDEFRNGRISFDEFDRRLHDIALRYDERAKRLGK